MREKLAWAEENGVTPPDYVVVAAAEEAAEDEPGSCCDRSEGEVASCCSQKRDRPKGGCCSSKRDATATDGQRMAGDAQDRTVEWVIGIHAQKCQGLSLAWVTSEAVLPPPGLIELPPETSPPAWYVPAAACQWQSVDLGFDAPPPRLS